MRIDPELVIALEWYFSNGAESAMGLRSNFGSMVMQLKLCGAGSHNTVPDVEEKWISAASRSRAIRSALEKCTTDQRVALRAAFLDPRHVEPFGIATGIAPLTNAAHKVHHPDARTRVKVFDQEGNVIEWQDQLGQKPPA